MHTEPLKDSEGTFCAPVACSADCRRCHQQSVTWQSWESHCGGYEDFKFTCGACGHLWWVDGIDS